MNGHIMRYIVALAFLALLHAGSAFAAAPANGVETGAVDLDTLLEEVRQSRGAEQRINREREARFLSARDEQQKLLSEARAQEREEEQRADALRTAFERNEARLAELEEDLQSRSGELTDVFSIARQGALEAQGSIKNSVISAQFTDWTDTLSTIASRPHALTIEELEAIWLTMLEAISQNGKVTRFQAPVITAQGEEAIRTVTRVGVFNAVSDGSFLRYLPETNKLVELSRQPPARFTSLAAAMEQTSDGLQTFPIDPSRGAILSLIVHSPDVFEHIGAGGVIGYLIIVIGIIAFVIAAYRYVSLAVTRRRLAAQEKDGEYRADNPLGRLHLIAKEAGDISAKSLSARLHESVGNEAARLHRGLRTLGIFAAVAPLLGLLGTVTGMITTFQAITLFGSGDPRIMSGGISEALVTTELGLIVAIPTLLLHSFLSGRANGVVEVLEHHSSRLMAVSGSDH